MLRAVEAVAMAFGILLILSFSTNAQDASLREHILHPIGTPARPILLTPSISKETVPGFPALPIASWITFPTSCDGWRSPIFPSRRSATMFRLRRLS